MGRVNPSDCWTQPQSLFYRLRNRSCLMGWPSHSKSQTEQQIGFYGKIVIRRLEISKITNHFLNLVKQQKCTFFTRTITLLPPFINCFTFFFHLLLPTSPTPYPRNYSPPFSFYIFQTILYKKVLSNSHTLIAFLLILFLFFSNYHILYQTFLSNYSTLVKFSLLSKSHISSKTLIF